MGRLLEGEDGGGEMEWLGERMERVRWDDGEEMERENEGGRKEWSGLMERKKGKELVRKWVAWRLVDRGL
jgi:hypothetical protein